MGTFNVQLKVGDLDGGGGDAFRLETMDSPTAYRTPRRRRAYPGPKSIMGETPPRRWIAALVSLGAVL